MLLKKVKFYAMRSVKNKTIRDKMIDMVSARIGKGKNFDGPSKYITAPTDKHVENLRVNGFTELDNKLSDEVVDSILQYSQKLKCFDPFHRELGEFDIADVDDKTHVANFHRKDLVQHLPIIDIANDPGILNTIQDYLKARPTISNVNMWWSMGGKEQAEDAQLFHRDVDDFRFCKLFIYLTDVSAESGPHTYVKGSSASPKLRKIRRYQDKEVTDVFGEENVMRFTRPKGSMFIVDTYGFHKGLLPKSDDRLLLQVQYSLNPIGIEKYEPISVDTDKYDTYVNRLIIKQG